MWLQSANHSLSLWWAWTTAPWEYQTKLLHSFFTSNNKSNLDFWHPGQIPDVYGTLLKSICFWREERISSTHWKSRIPSNFTDAFLFLTRCHAGLGIFCKFTDQILQFFQACLVSLVLLSSDAKRCRWMCCFLDRTPLYVLPSLFRCIETNFFIHSEG